MAVPLLAASLVSSGCGKTTAPPSDPDHASDENEIVVTDDVAEKLGARGFSVSGVSGHGWTRSGPEGAVLARLSGPPGGPLGFEVRAYSDSGPGSGSIEKLFRQAVSMEPSKVGAPEKVRLAGAERDAQSFRTGVSLATSSWCAIKLPADEDARTGILLLAHVATSEDAVPKCAQSLEHSAIKPLVDSFALE